MANFERDDMVVQLVHQFKQLSASQIRELVFADVSRSPYDATMFRLMDGGYVCRLQHIQVGGPKAGGGEYVYVLDREGYQVMTGINRRPLTAVNKHTLDIANTYLAFLRLARAGGLKIVSYFLEPECHQKLGGYRLDPDLYIELEYPDGSIRKRWIEVDRGTKLSSEGRKEIEGKLTRYTCVREKAYELPWPEFLFAHDKVGNRVLDPVEHSNGSIAFEPRREYPRIIFVTLNDWRLTALKRIVSHKPEESRRLFEVMQLQDIPTNYS